MFHSYRIKAILLTVFIAIPLSGLAQVGPLDSLMNLAKNYHLKKEYMKSNECYEQILATIQPYDGDARLTNIIRGTMAINYIYSGVDLFKDKYFAEAKPYFEKALEYAANDPKALPVANSWMGDWYSWKALDMRISKTDLQQAVEYSLMAEHHYKQANATDKLLKEQVSRSAALHELLQIESAKQLLLQVIGQCESVESRERILASALCELGEIELKSENFQSAILYLERCYGLSISKNKPTAYLAAIKLVQLYETDIPDQTKAELWKSRAETIDQQE